MGGKKKEKQLEADKAELLEIFEGRELGPAELRKIIDLATRIPSEIYFSIFLAYAWSKTHDGSLNMGDLMLGTLGGFTLAPALQGNIVANAWAIAYLAGLGWNFADPLDGLEEFLYNTGDAANDVFRRANELRADGPKINQCMIAGGTWNVETRTCDFPEPPTVPPTE